MEVDFQAGWHKKRDSIVCALMTEIHFTYPYSFRRIYRVP